MIKIVFAHIERVNGCHIYHRVSALSVRHTKLRRTKSIKQSLKLGINML